ncbi:MAG: NAD(P)H-binding protein [Phycisphaerales bacterium]
MIDALKPGAWSGVCAGMDAVVSTIGASVNPSPLVGFKPYTKVDAPANIALLDEAKRAGVGRFVYVSLVGGNTSRHMNYSEGHERVVDALCTGGIQATVLRPTGFFCAMADMIPLACKGVVPVFGDGSCRTNPIDEHDLAVQAAIAAESESSGLTQVELGGPDTFTRDQVAQMAFEVIGKRPRLFHVPVGLANAGAACLTPFNPCAAHFVRFAAHVMSHDCLAPAVGTRRLAEYFRQHAARK